MVTGASLRRPEREPRRPNPQRSSAEVARESRRRAATAVAIALFIVVGLTITSIFGYHRARSRRQALQSIHAAPALVHVQGDEATGYDLSGDDGDAVEVVSSRVDADVAMRIVVERSLVHRLALGPGATEEAKEYYLHDAKCALPGHPDCNTFRRSSWQGYHDALERLIERLSAEHAELARRRIDTLKRRIADLSRRVEDLSDSPEGSRDAEVASIKRKLADLTRELEESR